MAEPRMARTGVEKINLDKMTHSVCLLATNFRMGIGNMKQIRNAKVETTADQTQVRSQKKLVDLPSLDEIRSQDAKLRRYLDLKTCTYVEGLDFLPFAMLQEVDKVMLAYQKIRRPSLVAEFMKDYRAEYDTDFSARRLTLGDVFKREDYPHPEDVEAGFSFNYSISALESSGALQVIDSEIFEREMQKERLKMAQAGEEWRAALRLAGLGMVDALFEVLKPEPGKKKKLYDSHVGHLQEFLSTYNFRDITDDTEFQKHIGTIRQIMDGITPERLRHSENLKSYVATKLKDVKDELGALVITSGRKFR